MKSRAGILLGAALLLGMAAVGAEERSGGPLEDSKQELKALQAAQAAKNGADTGKLTDGLPQLQAPVPGAAPAEIVAPERLERELKKRQATQKNWLLDGVGSLEKEARAKGREKPGRDDLSSEGTTDPSEPDSLLKLYRAQEKNTAAKADVGKQRGVSAPADPLAPFLRGWLADSPVRGQFFDEFTRKAEAGNGDGASGYNSFTGARPVQTASGDEFNGSARAPAPASSAQRNAYLQGMEPAVPRDVGLANNLPSGPGVGSDVGTLGSPSAGGLAAPILPERPPEKMPPVLAPSDAQKYFPQQKKF